MACRGGESGGTGEPCPLRNSDKSFHTFPILIVLALPLKRAGEFWSWSNFLVPSFPLALSNVLYGRSRNFAWTLWGGGRSRQQRVDNKFSVPKCFPFFVCWYCFQIFRSGSRSEVTLPVDIRLPHLMVKRI